MKLLPGRDLVMLTLAFGLVFAVDAVTVGVLYDAIRSAGPGLSDNATQVLTTAFGGIIGVLGSYVGYKAATAAQEGKTMTEISDVPSDPSEEPAAPEPEQPDDEVDEAGQDVEEG